MNPWTMEPEHQDRPHNWRLGLGLALFALLYVGAVIAFIVLY